MPFLESFRTVRWVRTVNLILQAILFVTFFAGLNYVAFNRSLRFDLTSGNRYSLSAETLGYVRALKQPVRVVVTLSENSDFPQVVAAMPDVRGLLREFAFATEGSHDPATGHDGRIIVDYLNVYQRNREAAQLNIGPDTIVFISGEKSRTVRLDEIFRIEQGRFTAFLGEQVFASAIRDVSSMERRKIYFLSSGNGEARIDDTDRARGLSLAVGDLRQRNFTVEQIDPGAAGGIPADADDGLVVIVGPRLIPKLMQEQLRQYLATRNGRLLVFLEPGSDHRLEALFEDWGVLANDDFVLEPDPNFLTPEGELRVLHFGTRPDGAAHPVTKPLTEMKNVAPRIRGARSLRPDPARSTTSGLLVTTLAQTSPSAWGERSYREQKAHTFDPLVDTRPMAALEPKDALGLVVASERIPPLERPQFSVADGRLIVFGSSDFITNRGYENSQGNQNLVLNAVDWAVGRNSLLKAPERSIQRFQLSLSARQLTRLRYSVLLVLPGAAAVMGLLVFWARRT